MAVYTSRDGVTEWKCGLVNNEDVYTNGVAKTIELRDKRWL